jgi:hypothetical protein
MVICPLATAVLIISVLGIICDIYLFGFYISSILMNIIFTIIAVFITNWSCYKVGYNWIAWVIVFINLLGLFAIIYLVKNKNTEVEKKLIEEEKKNRNKK